MNQLPQEQGLGQRPVPGGNFPPQGPGFPAQPQLQSPQQPAKRGISRRTVLIGSAVGALGLIVVGGVAWLEITHQKTSSSPGGTTSTASANNNTSPTTATTPNPTDTSTPQAADTSTPGPGSTPVNGAIATYAGHSCYIQALAWSPDSSKIATTSGDGSVQIWNAASGTPVYTYTGHQTQNTSVNAVAWSQDGNYIFSAGIDVQVWKAADGTKRFTYTGHSNNTIHCLALSPDGKRIASGSDDSSVQIWDAQTGTHYITHTANTGVHSLTWSPDGARIASTQNDLVEVWNSSTGNTLNTYKGHSGNNVNAIAWSPNGKYIASGSGDPNVSDGSDDHTAQVWQPS
jgi:WD40 repeat protein